jgi:hypothetical protein
MTTPIEPILPETSPVRDQFAEMYVAGILADDGWELFFPYRDRGFDFVIFRQIDGHDIWRPVQVKGLYKTYESEKGGGYGFHGRLSRRHPEMVLAMPYFTSQARQAPHTIGFMPNQWIRTSSNATADRPHRCEPARVVDGIPEARPNFARFFDEQGLLLLQNPGFSQIPPLPTPGQAS